VSRRSRDGSEDIHSEISEPSCCMQENISKSRVNIDCPLVETHVCGSTSLKVMHLGGMECVDVKSPKVRRPLIPEDMQ
jgi:hypothetical protein